MRRRIVRLGVMAVVLAVGVGVTSAGATHVFDDVPDGKFYSDAIKWASENGITNGRSATMFDPDAPVTRGESVTFLKRYHDRFVDVLPRVYWAAVNGDGTVTRGSDGVTAAPAVASGLGFYEVDFGVDVTECTYAASSAEAEELVPTGTYVLPEVTVSVTPKPGDPEILLVHTGDADGSTLSRIGADFHLQVMCFS